MKRSITRDPQTTALIHLDSRALPQYLTRDGVNELVAACRSDRDRLFVRVGFETGGRVSELIALRRSDVDLSNRQIRLRTLKRRSDRRRKRPEVFRWIPVSHSLCADLAAHFLEVYRNARITDATDPDYRMFDLTRQGAFALIRKAGDRAGLVARGGRKISPHILRHSFAMNCLTQGVPITILKELLGHASISSTMVYLKTDPAQAREFLSKVQF
jgi:integrase/recombinase XerD